MTLDLPDAPLRNEIVPFKRQLFKWIGNKQRYAHEIAGYFPPDIRTYREPFLGSGAVLGTLQPERAVGSDIFAPLISVWQQLAQCPSVVKQWYSDRYREAHEGDRVAVYERIKARYNAEPNGADFLFLSRACYGGVVRFRKKDGYMSTPCGTHPLMTPKRFNDRVDLWAARTHTTRFGVADYRDALLDARPGDLVYCDPPYVHSQTILYGAQSFDITALFHEIESLASRGVRVALSLDGSKKSGKTSCPLEIPDGLFKRHERVNMGRSMLRRFQMEGQTLEAEEVADRLLLTY